MASNVIFFLSHTLVSDDASAATIFFVTLLAKAPFCAPINMGIALSPVSFHALTTSEESLNSRSYTSWCSAEVLAYSDENVGAAPFVRWILGSKLNVNSVVKASPGPLLRSQEQLPHLCTISISFDLRSFA